ncbi:MAG: T9SS type A sorting domain-containing protein [Bacteroidota bacterium]
MIILIDDLIGLIYSQSEYASCSAETSPPPRVMLVPNPTTTQLTIHVDSPQHLQLIQISSMNGEVLLEITDFTQAFYTDLPSSTYFIHIYTAQSCTSHLWVLQ